MICEKGFHVSEVKDFDRHVRGGDRMLVAKFLKPRRWDLIVFRYPEDPSVMYVKRLVGLPGEEMLIDGGAVWADGKRLPLPDSLRGIEYLSEMPGGHVELWGTRAHPAKLGPDEYFVLGDFSAQAKDSRLWEQGAPGHPPYAVPQSYLRGVVTHIYWPLQRCRTLR
jgi:signal peptidase I